MRVIAFYTCFFKIKITILKIENFKIKESKPVTDKSGPNSMQPGCGLWPPFG